MTQIDWQNVKRVLIVKLRSIGDTVLTTPSLIALRRFLPAASIDILLEDWVAPLLVGSSDVDDVLIAERGVAGQLRTMRKLRLRSYDVVINLHGGTTATFYTAASGARHRIGLKAYQYSFLYNHTFPSPAEFWGSEKIHSAQQQLALLGFAGVPVDDCPRSRLQATDAALRSVETKLGERGAPFALFHPAAAFETKQWAPENFARAAEFLFEQGIETVAIAAKGEDAVLRALRHHSSVPITTFDDLALPEITALASRARLFVGNDSGVAHIAAAVQTPLVVIFGSSNRTHWGPWTDSANEMVYNELHCQPCPGYECAEYGEPKCILSVRTEQVFAAIERVLNAARKADITSVS